MPLVSEQVNHKIRRKRKSQAEGTTVQLNDKTRKRVVWCIQMPFPQYFQPNKNKFTIFSITTYWTLWAAVCFKTVIIFPILVENAISETARTHLTCKTAACIFLFFYTILYIGLLVKLLRNHKTKRYTYSSKWSLVVLNSNIYKYCNST